jgi:hypothetical protein
VHVRALLTGTRLFAGDSVAETLGLIFSREPNLATHLPIEDIEGIDSERLRLRSPPRSPFRGLPSLLNARTLLPH